MNVNQINMNLSMFRPFDDQFMPSKNDMPLDLNENKEQFSVKVNAPGVKKENVSVTFKNDTLTISVETKNHTEKNDDDNHWHFKERFYGKSTRKVQFPHGLVNAGDIDASVEDGVIHLILPKKQTNDDFYRVKVK